MLKLRIFSMIGHIKTPKHLHRLDREFKAELSADPTKMEGDWNFKGYYPLSCKQRPSCYTRQMSFKQVDNDNKDYHAYETSATKWGNQCDAEEGDKGFKGITWVHENKIQYGGGNNAKNPSFAFKYLASKFHFEEKDGEYARLFIKDKGVDKRCF